jgi:hypothetical protein
MNMEEQMSMVEILSEELGEKEVKIMALEKKLEEQENITKKFMKDTLIKDINEDMWAGDGYEIDIELKDIWEDVLKELNNNNWNEDQNISELYIYEITNFNTQVCKCFIEIRLRECNKCGMWETPEDLILKKWAGSDYYECKRDCESDTSSESESDSDTSSDEDLCDRFCGKASTYQDSYGNNYCKDGPECKGKADSDNEEESESDTSSDHESGWEVMND